MRGWMLPAGADLGAVNIFAEPPDLAAVACGGDIDPATGAFPADRRARLHAEMNQLKRRVVAEPESFWPDSLEGGARADNARLPAGYTYLLQLIGHDMVNSAPSGRAGAGFGLANAQFRPLLLDTIYGFGPETSPAAYEAERAADAFRTEPGRLPRRFLRTLPLPADQAPAKRWCCPFRDIARMAAPEAPSATEATEALVADPRNDAHALMSQMTVLFHVAHNAIYRAIAAATGNLERSDTEMARRVFACARAVLTLIWRRIVRFDVLPRIISPEVAALYGRGITPLKPFRGVPAEFGAGAFRFGHAMVRRDYVFNSGPAPGRAGPGFAALNSRRAPHHMPLSAAWMVDWAFFFDVRAHWPDAPEPLPSRRIGPRYSDALDVDPVFLPRAPGEGTGLSFRDYCSSIYAGQWSMPQFAGLLSSLLDHRQPGLGRRLVPDMAAHWQPLIRAWLQSGAAAHGANLPPAVAARLAADPPWPFFVLFEAAFRADQGQPTAEGMGRHLGAIGSIVTAETIIGALEATQLVPDEMASLEAAVAAACRSCLGADVAIAGITQPAGARDAGPLPEEILPQDMASFLVFLASLQAFDLAR